MVWYNLKQNAINNALKSQVGNVEFDTSNSKGGTEANVPIVPDAQSAQSKIDAAKAEKYTQKHIDTSTVQKTTETAKQQIESKVGTVKDTVTSKVKSTQDYINEQKAQVYKMKDSATEKTKEAIDKATGGMGTKAKETLSNVKGSVGAVKDKLSDFLGGGSSKEGGDGDGKGTPTNPSEESLYPAKGTFPTPAYKNRTSVNAVAVGKTKDTIVQTKNASKSTSTNFEQPDDLPSVYPNNHVWATKRHVIELDDTGAGKINIQHGSGSFIEIFPDGHIVVKSVGDCFILSNQKVNVQAMQDCNVDVRGNANVSVDGNCDAKIKGYADVKIGSDAKLFANGKFEIYSTNKMILGSKEEIVLDAPVINQQANTINHTGPTGCVPGWQAESEEIANDPNVNKEEVFGGNHDTDVDSKGISYSGVEDAETDGLDQSTGFSLPNVRTLREIIQGRD